jgi:mRNA-degrading endonuclease RelE of RelBE toxin-antitoxin system
MTFNLFLSKNAISFLDNISPNDNHRIIDKLKQLEQDPYSLAYKKIKGRQRTYRIRMGDFRLFILSMNLKFEFLRLDEEKAFTVKSQVDTDLHRFDNNILYFIFSVLSGPCCRISRNCSPSNPVQGVSSDHVNGTEGGRRVAPRFTTNK